MCDDTYMYILDDLHINVQSASRMLHKQTTPLMCIPVVYSTDHSSLCICQTQLLNEHADSVIQCSAKQTSHTCHVSAVADSGYA